ncbi:alpha subunit of pyruvate dehydrogenase [Serendipita sp. 411]|nr:alpha subunit of pyruvate dehydrogenase [Serendipita sp. 405]KAG8844731.1 alpha subunit of pyruvate dehydrogenase [Serendipita sp. 411]
MSSRLASISRRALSRRIPLGARSVQVAADSTKLSSEPGEPSQPFTVTLDNNTFKGYRTEAPGLEVSVTKENLMEWYKQMTLMRKMEQAAGAMYQAKLIRGFCHLAVGQEAISVGFHSAMAKDDKLITSYRCHPFAVLRGGTITGVLAELLGRQAGMSNGKGGSMHIFTPTFFGGNGIVGAQVPLGAGIAFADKYMNKETATFALYGDGAANQGQVFEAFNMASRSIYNSLVSTHLFFLLG